MIHDNDFAAMTAPLARPGMAAATEKPSRAKRSWPARLGKGERWLVAMRYACGEKTEAIAAEFGCTPAWVSWCARSFGLPLRRARGRPGYRHPTAADAEHLRRWARRTATALRKEAAAWEVLAALE